MDEKAHILVVEDERHLAVGIQYNLTAEGYDVEVVSDGRSALKYVDEHPGQIDLVVLDLMLPEMSGYDVCTALREQGETMPILILSARSLTEDRTRGFDVGADQYLTKPFELSELLSRIKNLLVRYTGRLESENAEQRLTCFEFGDARVDFETYEVSISGNPVRLTQLEMKLLEYFVRNEGKVISRGDLLEHVWDMPAHLNTRAPDQFIRRLRKTFEPQPASPRHFLTVRDAGYRFVAEADDALDRPN